MSYAIPCPPCTPPPMWVLAKQKREINSSLLSLVNSMEEINIIPSSIVLCCCCLFILSLLLLMQLYLSIVPLELQISISRYAFFLSIL